MKKEIFYFSLILSLILILSLSLVSAFSFPDFWNKITGKEISNPQTFGMISLVSPSNLTVFTHNKIDSLRREYVQIYFSWSFPNEKDIDYYVFVVDSGYGHGEVNVSSTSRFGKYIGIGEFKWKIKACNSLGCSDWSEQRTLIVNPFSSSFCAGPDNENISFGQCSSTKPLYCDNGNLINQCSSCGCSSGQQCQSDGSCKVGVNQGNNILLLHLDEKILNSISGGKDVQDISGNNHHGDEQGGVSFGATGKINTALSFDGVNDYVNLDDDVLDGKNKLTIEAWIKPEQKTSDYMAIMSDYRAFYFMIGYAYSYKGKLMWRTWDSNGQLTQVILSDNPVIKWSEWQHVAITFDGNVVKLYHNGIVVGKSYAHSGKTIYDLKYKTTIGGRGTVNSWFFKGEIDEVGVYDYALSEGDIVSYYNSNKNNSNRNKQISIICGNNIREGNEECDGSDNSDCPGKCKSDCTCETKIYKCGTYSYQTPVNAIASSEYSNAYSAKKAIDGNINTRWGTKFREKNKWIYFDLGKEKCINGIKLNAYKSYIPITFDISVSKDAINWVNVKKDLQLQEGNKFVEFKFDEIVAKYIRIYETKLSYKYDFGSLTEVEVSSADYNKKQSEIAKCGNNIREDLEECDGGDNSACPGKCKSDCTCETEKIEFGCFNNIKDFDEQGIDCGGSCIKLCPSSFSLPEYNCFYEEDSSVEGQEGYCASFCEKLDEKICKEDDSCTWRKGNPYDREDKGRCISQCEGSRMKEDKNACEGCDSCIWEKPVYNRGKFTSGGCKSICDNVIKSECFRRIGEVTSCFEDDFELPESTLYTKYTLDDPIIKKTATIALYEYAEHEGIDVIKLDTPYDYMDAVAWYVQEHTGWVKTNGPTPANKIITSTGHRCDKDYCGDCTDYTILRTALLRSLGVSWKCVFTAHAVLETHKSFRKKSTVSHSFNIVFYRGAYRIMDYYGMDYWLEERWGGHKSVNSIENDATLGTPLYIKDTQNYLNFRDCPTNKWTVETYYTDVCPYEIDFESIKKKRYAL